MNGLKVCFPLILKDYDEDFENFDDDVESDREVKPKKDSNSKKKQTKYSSEEEEEDARRITSGIKSKSKSNHYEDDNFRDGKVIKANANVILPTESVIVASSKIFFNHDSQDRQRRRAKDLLKTIELDTKNFNLLDLNPLEMRTVYSSHLRHVNISSIDVFFSFIAAI